MNKFADLGRLWGLLNEGYGRLIELYCGLILQKLKFHARYQVSFQFIRKKYKANVLKSQMRINSD